MVVDDDRQARALLREALATRGHSVIEAVDGADAVAQLKDHAPAVVLLDIEMPMLSGYDALRRIRSDERLRGTKVLALTGYAMAGDRERTLQAGFDAYIPKPISLALLFETIARLTAAEGAG